MEREVKLGLSIRICSTVCCRGTEFGGGPKVCVEHFPHLGHSFKICDIILYNREKRAKSRNVLLIFSNTAHSGRFTVPGSVSLGLPRCQEVGQGCTETI